MGRKDDRIAELEAALDVERGAVNRMMDEAAEMRAELAVLRSEPIPRRMARTGPSGATWEHDEVSACTNGLWPECMATEGDGGILGYRLHWLTAEGYAATSVVAPGVLYEIEVDSLPDGWAPSGEATP